MNAYDLTDPRDAFDAIEAERRARRLGINSIRAAGVALNSWFSWRKMVRSPMVSNLVLLASAFGFAIVVTKNGAEFSLSDQPAAISAFDAERKILGMSLGEMEDRSGVSVNSFYYWKSGKRSPQLVNLVALAQTLGFEVMMVRKK
ncbi:helix-turn-helix transcriptional regulator [Agrobacterium tumefaciens]|uniref:helix-turn-helix domain-containing protein n=1 Tax=Agrobacterium tumefaciens TaxID=358 RepID=UPI001573F7B8|nr:helix-turn-helix transcriptional regulator [Agrobacterium tumefaciens]NTE55079.1 helix-turn-helix transcriptional regulator [Agrobacterium tumefaciens]NTE73847.1 helix-turn-helix transcriptional regulator [Agrobacterium tumefaciens]